MADVNWTTDITANNAEFVTSIETGMVDITATMDVGIGMPVIYTGATTVIPAVVAQELATANKLVQQDILIEEIPYSEVSNIAGGWTVNIG